MIVHSLVVDCRESLGLCPQVSSLAPRDRLILMFHMTQFVCEVTHAHL